MDDKLKKVVSSIIKDFLKKNKRDPKDLKELALFVLSLGGKKYIERKTQEVLGKQPKEQPQEQTTEQKLKALHGAKLNYFKSLKHQCAEDEEVVYYKKGGSVGCGCKKKENGGEVKKDCGGSAIKKFKMQFGNKMMQLAEANKERKKKEEQAKKRKGTWAETTDFIPGEKGILKPSLSKETKEDKIYNSGKETVPESSLTKKKAVKKGANGTYVDVPMWAMDPASKWQKQDYLKSNGVNPNTWKGTKAFTDAPSLKKGDKVKKNKKDSAVDKFKSAKCGSKMKKHYFGGSLNRIPFYQEGTIRGGIYGLIDNTKNFIKGITGDLTPLRYLNNPNTYTQGGFYKYLYNPLLKKWTILRGMHGVSDNEYTKGRNTSIKTISGNNLFFTPVNSTFDSYNDGTTEFRNDGTVYYKGKKI